MNAKRNIAILLRYPKSIVPVMQNFLRSLTLKIDYNFKDGYSFNPKGISVLVTKNCNLRCKMCHFYHSSLGEVKLNPQINKKNIVDIKVIENLVKNWKGIKPYITLTGGEPTLHPQIEEIIKLIKNKGFVCTMVSNGALLKEKAEAILDAGLDILAVSIDGNGEIHDNIRGVSGTYNRAIEAIRGINKLKIKKKTPRPLIFLNTTMLAENLNYFEHLVNLANKLKADGINFQHLWLQTENMNLKHNSCTSDFKINNKVKLEVDNNSVDTEKLFLEIEKIRKKHSFINIFPDLNFKQTKEYYTNLEEFIFNSPSFCSWFFASVQTDGRVTHCKEIEMGNLSSSSFQEIWNSKKFRHFRKEIKKKSRFPICSRCCLYFRKF